MPRSQLLRTAGLAAAVTAFACLSACDRKPSTPPAPSTAPATDRVSSDRAAHPTTGSTPARPSSAVVMS